ncbi:hypothetical protein FDZ73_19790 [bacterium]|nr:MAG: hypothetical protein FDZ73_19790 [bacterium]
MALDADELSVWEIAFRWADRDPDELWFRIPLLVRDNLRVLMGAILNGEIICSTLCLDKRPSGLQADPAYYIRTHIDDVYACIHGVGFKRNLLRWATLDRQDFLVWCSCRGIAPPEFWFPPGWKHAYEHPDGLLPGLVVRHNEPESDGTLVHFSYDWPEGPEPDTEEQGDGMDANESGSASLRRNQIATIACQQIAKAIWSKDPTRRIADVIRDELIQEYGGAKYFNEATVREWIKTSAPPDVRANRGRPRKK